MEKIKDDTNSPPIIVVSNLYDKEIFDKATSLGAKDYIVKVQSTPEEIVDRVIEFLKTNKRSPENQ